MVYNNVEIAKKVKKRKHWEKYARYADRPTSRWYFLSFLHLLDMSEAYNQMDVNIEQPLWEQSRSLCRWRKVKYRTDDVQY